MNNYEAAINDIGARWHEDFRRHVTLIPAFHGAVAGYQAVLVADQDDELSDQVFRTVVRKGPFCDAALVARTRAIEWADRIGEPVDPAI